MIEAKNLCFQYEEEAILQNISLSIKEGSYTAFIGANGSGKTTLAKHFNALLMPTKGTILVDNIDTKKYPFAVRKKVGFVFQNPEDQLVHSIVEEDIAFGLENIGMETRAMKERVNFMLKELAIGHLAKKNVNALSMGQKQLTALAGVLAMNPKYVVFDEPTTMLDNRNKKNILSIINTINEKNNIGIIMVTNVLDDIKYAEKVVVLKNGKMIFNDKKSKLSQKIIREAGLDA